MSKAAHDFYAKPGEVRYFETSVACRERPAAPDAPTPPAEGRGIAFAAASNGAAVSVALGAGDAALVVTALNGNLFCQ